MFMRFEHILPKIITLLVLISVPYSTTFARERIHIFTSKGIYETCDELWFKCVAFDDSTMHVSDRSHTAYVEIIDSSDSVVWQEKYRMSKGICDGHAYVGNEWKPGEYRMLVHTKNSLGKNDTIIYPKLLLIVKGFSDIPVFLGSAKERTRYIDLPDSASAQKLNVTVSLDSAEYHTRSKVKATVKVTDANGKPVQAVLAISVTDNLYSYPPSEVDIQSQICGLEHDSFGERERERVTPILAGGAVSGHLRSGRKKNTDPLDGQFINVFNDRAEKGAVNIISTGREGYFEVSPDIASSLGSDLLLRPLVDEDLKPRMEIDKPFSEIEKIRKRATEKYHPILRKKTPPETDVANDTTDYSGRRIVRLEELVVEGKGVYNARRKNNKLLNYLDSLAISRGSAWVCCDGFLNDYFPGWTHHPQEDPYFYRNPPQNIRLPERGKVYTICKYTFYKDYTAFTVDESYAMYEPPHYSDDDLLEMEGIYKAKGYYPKHRFPILREEDVQSCVDDFRDTLLWLPRAQTDETGEFSVEFITSDITSVFRISGFILTPDLRDAVTVNEYFQVK